MRTHDTPGRGKWKYKHLREKKTTKGIQEYLRGQNIKEKKVKLIWLKTEACG